LAPAETPDRNVRAKSADSASHGSARAQPGEEPRAVLDRRREAVLGGEAVLDGEDDGGEVSGEAPAEVVGSPELVVGADAVAAAVEVDQHRQLIINTTLFAGGHGRRRRPVQADPEAARRVVHGVLPLDAGDFRERLLRPHEHGLVAADDGAVAEEPDDAEQVLHDVRRRRVARHGWWW